jgi:pyridoxine 4-dehydrogenase
MFPTCHNDPMPNDRSMQSATLSDVAARLDATPMPVALAWFLRRSPNILVTPGTSSIEHLRENLQASRLQISSEGMADLDSIIPSPEVEDNENRSCKGWMKRRD